ncbi:isochorismatase family protein [Siccirubricoccus phaeus]|uniref:isochorismatase family protein n=1 Tax=Siccirubricoccus phaeus TaxID=2595053 RepID=UPI0011F2751C|nr:isochorismatase family cysteine hydrolase [Siccirubricoccus phaeus]
MHKIELLPSVVARAEERRGGLRVFPGLDPKRTAHVVVDLQNGFMAPGQISAVATAPGIVPNVNRISAALRAAGGLVVYLQHTADPATAAGWGAFYNGFMTPERKAGMIAAFTPGAFGHALWPELEVLPQDLVVRKTRFSGFVQGSSDLDAQLRARRIDTVVITGTVTNVCCESSARDAMMLDYKVFFTADGNAAHSDAEHNATLSNLANVFCDVVTTAELTGMIAAAAPRAAAE